MRRINFGCLDVDIGGVPSKLSAAARSGAVRALCRGERRREPRNDKLSGSFGAVSGSSDE
jgi:hypothetical protein